MEKRFINAIHKKNAASTMFDATTSVDGTVSTTTSVNTQKKSSSGSSGGTSKPTTAKKVSQEIPVTFKCIDVEGATLFWEDQVPTCSICIYVYLLHYILRYVFGFEQKNVIAVPDVFTFIGCCIFVSYFHLYSLFSLSLPKFTTFYTSCGSF